ncbi:hypothetical protein AGMMS49992_20080 [Clostridia bacterium]|nr:hypothetical protein AGMMS49992_20080 [Clostridia bacterium]
MPRDVVVVVRTDAKPRPAEVLDTLLVSTSSEQPLQTFRSLDAIATVYPTDTTTYKQAATLFNQGNTTLASSLIRRVKIVGFDLQTNDAGTEIIERLEELQDEDNDWYCFLTDQNDTETITALAAWAEDTEPTEVELDEGAEDHRKLYFCTTSVKTPFITNRRTVIAYSADPDECLDAAWLGNVGPFYPQSVTYKFKLPQGCAVHPLSEAERDVLIEGHVNFMAREYKHEYMKEGVCADGEYIDVQMGADWIARAMREELYKCLMANPKVPYTDEGFALIASCVMSTLDRATGLHIIAREPDSGRGLIKIDIPLRRDATDDEVRNRRMPNITWEAQLEGAIHHVKIIGTLRATLSQLAA